MFYLSGAVGLLIIQTKLNLIRKFGKKVLTLIDDVRMLRATLMCSIDKKYQMLNYSTIQLKCSIGDVSSVVSFHELLPAVLLGSTMVKLGRFAVKSLDDAGITSTEPVECNPIILIARLTANRGKQLRMRLYSSSLFLSLF